ncbi:hypothetical protein TNIN_137011 [Trichonephila inaurata madagascariensis]|uniref:Uncharacterized protein n=1 Tax=Trichonephila inaurata madagascariensis TaxID=2747483 RepID=A0A8X7CGK4_9ARAC|nr:hypothetical protein TNIN_137011 [Trichonephila inaurata madagascariensis]
MTVDRIVFIGNGTNLDKMASFRFSIVALTEICVSDLRSGRICKGGGYPFHCCVRSSDDEISNEIIVIGRSCSETALSLNILSSVLSNIYPSLVFISELSLKIMPT